MSRDRRRGPRATCVASRLPPSVAGAAASSPGSAPTCSAQRAERVRSECGLRRWVAEPGVDTWWGTFPSEDAAGAWAAIDDLARRLVADGVCTGIEQARAKALTDLVLAHSTVTVSVVLTVPAGRSSLVRRARACRTGVPAAAATLAPAADETTTSSRCAGCGRRSRLSSRAAGSTPTSLPDRPPSSATARAVRASTRPRRRPTGPRRRWPSVVRARDGRCRFPGCSVAARFCDLDHVRPWPAGPTAADNLACLCRRHHRIKQRPGWRVRMMPGAVLEWTDPTGRVRTTTPIDALAALVLRAADGAPVPSRGRRPRGRHRSRSARWSSPRNTSLVPAPAPAPAPRRVLPNPRAPPRSHVEGGRPGPHRRASGRRGRTIPLARPPTRSDAAPSLTGMELEFSGVVWHWRGPSPYHFVSVPDEECGALRPSRHRSATAGG